jgi:hypothetical protein
LEDIKTFNQIDYFTIAKDIKDKQNEIKSLKENDKESKIYREKLEKYKIEVFELNKKRDKKI